MTMSRPLALFCAAAWFASGSAAVGTGDAQAPAPPPPAGVDPTLTSRNPDYGLSAKDPVKVGSKEEFGGPAAQRAYLESLRDEEGEPVAYKRIGSGGPGSGGTIVDIYEVTTSAGKKVRVYIDMYHPDYDPALQPAPAGFFKAAP